MVVFLLTVCGGHAFEMLEQALPLEPAHPLRPVSDIVPLEAGEGDRREEVDPG